MKNELQEFTLLNKNQYPHEIKDSRALIAACPSFKINLLTGEIELQKFLQFSNLQLISCFTQIESIGIKALLGIGWLLWDELLLQLITDKSLAVNSELKTIAEKEIIFIAQKNPNFDAVKEKIKKMEKNWLKMQNFQIHESKFICSGDLLENRECHLIFKKLKELYQETKFKNCIDGLANDFIRKHFSQLLHQDISSSQEKKTPSKELALAKAYMTEYFLFENAAFAHLALQGFPLLICKDRNIEIEKAMSMVMAYFTKFIENPLMKKMQIVLIKFHKKSPALFFKSSPASSKSSISPQSSPNSSPPDSPSIYDKQMHDIELLVADLKNSKVSPRSKIKAINALTECEKEHIVSVNHNVGFWGGFNWTNMAIAATIAAVSVSITAAFHRR